MIIWINGSFGVGKSETSRILHEILPNSHIYDPEQVGYFLWDNFPNSMKRQGDFQDIVIWRSINYEIIKHLAETYQGDLIIPMTMVNAIYYNEIVGRLKRDGIDVKHFILTAPRETIIKRLIQRGDGENSWAEQQIDRCLTAYEKDITGIKVDTSDRDARMAAEYILELL